MVPQSGPWINVQARDPPTTTGTVDCCFEHACQNPDFLVPPETRPALATAWVGRFPTREGLTVVEVLHERCAGMDISKKDVKVCVRVPGGRGGR